MLNLRKIPQKNYNTYTPLQIHHHSVVNETLTIAEMYSGCVKKVNYLRFKKGRMENVQKQVIFPAGIKDGDKLTFIGEGDEYENTYGNIERCNLIVEIYQAPDKVFTRVGDTLYMTMDITALQARHGFQKDVFLPDGSYFTLYAKGGIKKNDRHCESCMGFNNGHFIIKYNIIDSFNKYMSDSDSESESAHSWPGDLTLYSSSSPSSPSSPSPISSSRSSIPGLIPALDASYRDDYINRSEITDVFANSSYTSYKSVKTLKFTDSQDSLKLDASVSKVEPVIREVDPALADFEVHNEIEVAEDEIVKQNESPTDELTGFAWLFSFIF